MACVKRELIALHQAAFLQPLAAYVDWVLTVVHLAVLLLLLAACAKRELIALHQAAFLQPLVPCVKQELTALHQAVLP